MKVRVLEPARREFTAALRYYEMRSPKLANEFRAAIRAQLLKITSHPTAWMLIKPTIRKCLGGRFPYDVIYQVQEREILILAFAHKRRRPGYWSMSDSE